MGLAAVLLTGTSIQAFAQTAGHVWAGCVLSPEAVAALEASVDAGAGIGTPEVAFVVVYSLKENDGQPIGSGFTGPVICTNPGLVATPAPTTQTTDIGTASDTVTILDAEEAFLLRYQFEDAPTDIEKRVCHTVDSNTDCFLITPPTD
jgi:hypothetical protein